MLYSNPYEEYMRNSLGYNGMPIMNMNQMNTRPEMYETEENYMCNDATVENMYPEIYKIIYPMVCKACMAINENITEDLVSRITNEIYINVENAEIATETRNALSQLNKNIKTEVSNNRNNTSTPNNNSSNTRQETRQQNPLLRDLIRILVLRELIGNPAPGPRPRPPFNQPVRPPFGPGPRPPFAF